MADTQTADGSAELVATRANIVMGFASKLKDNAAQSFKEVGAHSRVARRLQAKSTADSGDQSCWQRLRSCGSTTELLAPCRPCRQSFTCRLSHGQRCLTEQHSQSLRAWLRCAACMMKLAAVCDRS